MKTKKIKEMVKLDAQNVMNLYEDTVNAIEPNESTEVTFFLYSIFLFPCYLLLFNAISMLPISW